MAYGVVHHSPAERRTSTRRRSLRCTRATEASPRGSCSTRRGRRETAWTIVAIHDAQESWETFRDGILMPRMAAGIDGGFTVQPQETTFPVHYQATA